VRLLFVLAQGSAIMETLLQFLVIVGGLMFSLATALLIEELIFGRIFRMVFAHRPEASNPGQEQ
jgi:hypothetical protein